MRTNQKGFSLIELMIVVAIIGILSAIAVPNYMAFQRKARQSEARSTLGAIAQAETVYSQDAGGYTSDIKAAGYIPDGTIAYDCGFDGAIAFAYGPNDTATYVAANQFRSTLPLCGTADAPNCAALAAGGAGIVGMGTLAGTAYAANAYTIGCYGWIGGQNEDRWTVSQLKVITNLQSGI